MTLRFVHSRAARRFMVPAILLGVLWDTASADAQQLTAVNTTRVADNVGGSTQVLDDGDLFASALAPLGDVDGDGVEDVVVGAPFDDDGGADQGAVSVLLLNADGTVKAEQKISADTGGFGGVLGPDDHFGASLALLGDLDGNGKIEIAVGAPGDDDGGPSRGAVWIVSLKGDGQVDKEQKISAVQGGFAGPLQDGDQLGNAVASPGDVDGDGIPDLAVGERADGDGGPGRGAAWILFLNADGTVKAQQKISNTQGGFGGTLEDGDGFGASLAGVGDANGDGVPDLAVGADGDDDGGPDRGAVWLLHLNPDGTVAGHTKVSATMGGFAGVLADGDGFGGSLASLGDVDGDGIVDLAIGAAADDDGGAERGAVWLVQLSAGGAVKAAAKLSSTQGGFGAGLNDGDAFGAASAAIGDIDGDGIGELIVGAPGSDGGGSDRGALWIVFFSAPAGSNAARPRPVLSEQKISASQGGLLGLLAAGDGFGSAVAPLGDLDGDGVTDLAVGSSEDDTAGGDRGAVWILFMNADGTVKADQRITEGTGGFADDTSGQSKFGTAIAPVGDIDGDGVVDIVVGAPERDDGGNQRGAVWILFLNAGGTVKAYQRIGTTAGTFAGVLDDGDWFGRAVASLGDLDGDGTEDVAVGAVFDDDGGPARGAVWILFLNADGTVKAHQKISDTAGGFQGTLTDGNTFGASAANLGDLDGDGVADLAVGAPLDRDGGPSRGAVWILFLNPDGTVKAQQKISDTVGNFGGTLADGDVFGAAVAAGGDLDGDGLPDLIAGAQYDNDGGINRGAVWALLLNADGTVKAHQKISDTVSSFGGALDDDDEFGYSLTPLGDLDGNAVSEWVVGSWRDDDLAADAGAVWVLFLGGCGNAVVDPGEQCDDGNTADGDCCAADCSLEASGSTCDDGDVCTDEQCDGNGACVFAGNNAAPCDDGLFCNGADTCGGGTCSVHAGDPCPGADGDGDCAESCDEVGDVCTAKDADGSPCDDGTFCNGPDTCSNGTCTIHGGDPCPGADGDGDCAESCDETADACTAADANGSICDDGAFCNGADTCSAGACAVHTGDPCPGADGDGDCAESCDETADACTAADANGSICDDGAFCNGADTCSAGACAVHTGDPCPGADGDGDCAESCDETADACTAADANGSICDDGAFCNGTDTCNAGACAVHTGDPCPGADGDGDCAESCDETTDACTAADANGSICDDGAFCNGTDTCSAGACAVHTGDPCPGADGDGDCAESCDETTDACTAADANGSICDDGAFCNGVDTCSAGSCAPGPGDPCPGPDGDFDCGESCDEANDNCLATDPDGSGCDDGMFCNGADECSAGTCVIHLGNPCLGGPPCADTCDEALDTCQLPDGTPCDDGQWCTLTDACVAGECTSPDSPCGSSPTCTDTCNEAEQVCKGCGQPFSNEACVPNALVTIQAAVGLTPCEPCLCDVDNSGSIVVSDALTILFHCIGALPPPDQCPEIDALLLYGGTTTTTTIVPFGSVTSTSSTTTTSRPAGL